MIFATFFDYYFTSNITKMLVQFSPEYKESHSFKSNLQHYFWVVDTVSKQVDSSLPNLLLYVAVDLSIPAHERFKIHLYPSDVNVCYSFVGFDNSTTSRFHGFTKLVMQDVDVNEFYANREPLKHTYKDGTPMEFAWSFHHDYLPMFNDHLVRQETLFGIVSADCEGFVGLNYRKEQHSFSWDEIYLSIGDGCQIMHPNSFKI